MAHLHFSPQLECLTSLALDSLEHQEINIVTIKINIFLGVVFETDAIDSTKPANKDYIESIGLSSMGYPLYIELRHCEVGE